MPLLRPDEMIGHPMERDVRFRVLGVLGAGGFGEAYEVVAVNEDDEETDRSFCMKVTKDDVAWHGETYFMSLLQGHKHAMQIMDSFPIQLGQGEAARMRFAIVMPIMPLSVSDACEVGELPWPEDRVIRQLRLMLGALGILHEISTPHRDITPYNTYVGDRKALVLGDYGIAKTARLIRGVHADAFNPAFRPPDLKTFWDRRDDIYQVGLLALTLLTGEVQTSGVRKPFVNRVTSNGALREVIKIAIGVKSERFGEAEEMAVALGQAAR